MSYTQDNFQVGDTVRVSRLIVVTRVGVYGLTEGLAYFPGKEYDYPNGHKFDFELVERPIENWPPQEHDIWRSGAGRNFHIMRAHSGILKAFHSDAEYYGIDRFKAMEPRLLFRTEKEAE